MNELEQMEAAMARDTGLEEVVANEIAKYCSRSVVIEDEEYGELTLVCDRDEEHKGQHHDNQAGQDFVWYDVVMMVGHVSDDVGLGAKCSCGWEREPTKDLLKMGHDVFGHCREWGHLPRPNEEVTREDVAPVESEDE